MGKEQRAFPLDPFVLSGVLGGKSPNGVGKEPPTLPLNPFVLSLSKGECREPRHPISLFPPISCQMHAHILLNLKTKKAIP